MTFDEYIADLGEYHISGVPSGFHIVMQRLGEEARIEGRSDAGAGGLTHLTLFSCFGTKEKLGVLADLLSRNDAKFVLMRSASLQGHSGNPPIKFRCRPGNPDLRLLDIEYPIAADRMRTITLKDSWDRKLPASQAVKCFERRLQDLLKDFEL